MEVLRRLFKDEEGQGLIEYVLIVGLIALVAVAAILAAGGHIGNIWNKVRDTLGTVPVT